MPHRVLLWMFRELTGRRKLNYLAKVNPALLSARIIRSPMSPTEIWTVTDIHVHDNKGISIRELSGFLSDYDLIAARSYAFFGKLHSELPAECQEEEERLTRQCAPNGFYVCAAWRKRRHSSVS